MSDTPQSPLLKIEGIRKRFGDTLVLNEITLEASTGEIIAVVGENGSGKSTLMRILSGSLGADGGTMRLQSKIYAPQNPKEALRKGMAMVSQDETICPELTAAENIVLGNETASGRNHHLGILWDKPLLERAKGAYSRVSSALIDFQKGAGLLSGGQRKSVMIARALLSSPTVLILDEPTNALGLSEQNELFELVRRLKQQGLCIFYVSHKPAEITEVADRVVGFKQGRITKTLRKGEFDETRLMRLMMGT